MNTRLINSVAVGLVIVDGNGQYNLTQAEKIDMISEAMEGLDWLGNYEPDAKISWHYIIREVSVNITPWTGANWVGMPDNFYIKNGGIAGGLDAAFQNYNGQIYFFKGNQYVRFSHGGSGGVDSGFPREISSGWIGLPIQFQNGIDAAFQRGNRRIYFFKGNQYVRFSNDGSGGVDSGFPREISSDWLGLPGNFQQGIDAAFQRDNGQIYFFKKDDKLPKYVRFSNGGEGGVDADYPKPIGLSRTQAEKLWRDPAMGKLGYSSDDNGVSDFLSDIRNLINTENGVVAFFTKYPTTWFGYALSAPSRIVMRYLGSSRMDIVFAHEVCHKFGAPDEYRNQPSSYCGELKGRFFKVIDGNNISCTDNIRQESGYPRTIADHWHGLPVYFQSDIDAALMRDNGKIYFFKGNQYVRLSTDGGIIMDPGYPRTIADHWHGLPANFQSNIDAALMRDNGKIYFFKGNQYVRLSTEDNTNMDSGYPRTIADNWQGLPGNFQSNIDAALIRDNEKIYFFKGNQYVRFSTEGGINMDPGYPKTIENNWENISNSFNSNLDAALMRDNGKIYFFKGNRFTRFTDGFDCIMLNNSYEMCQYTPYHIGWGAFMQKIDAAFWNIDNDKLYLFSEGWYARYSNVNDGIDDGYPIPISSTWLGLPNSFRQGIDAALMLDNKKIYFFKGTQYVRFSNGGSGGVDPEYPKTISSNWLGLPNSFQQGIDAALILDNGKIYFFKGTQYVRFSNGGSGGVDSGYPRTIESSWLGLPSTYTNGIHAAVMRRDNNKIYFFNGRTYARFSNGGSGGMDTGYTKWINGHWMPFPTIT